jgi:ADP-heptose:LPS heptosyltransferase
MAIPFDGRWKNGLDYIADRVLDGRKRPDNVERLGFDMWKKHEVLYQMENPIELGYTGSVPSSRFFGAESGDRDLVYLGIGYKRDAGGFGLSKHFGNDRFVQLMRAIRERRPTAHFISTGSVADFVQIGGPLMKQIADPDLYKFITGAGLPYAFTNISKCGSYIGNDTGMMHVAASLEMPVLGLFLSQDLVRKNHPWETEWICSNLDAPISEIAENFCSLVWGKE